MKVYSNLQFHGDLSICVLWMGHRSNWGTLENEMQKCVVFHTFVLCSFEVMIEQ